MFWEALWLCTNTAKVRELGCWEQTKNMALAAEVAAETAAWPGFFSAAILLYRVPWCLSTSRLLREKVESVEGRRGETSCRRKLPVSQAQLKDTFWFVQSSAFVYTAGPTSMSYFFGIMVVIFEKSCALVYMVQHIRIQ